MIEEYADCGLDGKDDAPVKIGAFNRLLRRVGKVHLAPIKKVTATMQSHVEECALLQAKISGGVRVIIYLMALCATVGTALLITLLTHRFGL